MYAAPRTQRTQANSFENNAFGQLITQLQGQHLLILPEQTQSEQSCQQNVLPVLLPVHRMQLYLPTDFLGSEFQHQHPDRILA